MPIDNIINETTEHAALSQAQAEARARASGATQTGARSSSSSGTAAPTTGAAALQSSLAPTLTVERADIEFALTVAEVVLLLIIALKL